MTQFENNNFGDVLLNRHSVRHFDKTVKIPREELREMIKETITAPSAVNNVLSACSYNGKKVL